MKRTTIYIISIVAILMVFNHFSRGHKKKINDSTSPQSTLSIKSLQLQSSPKTFSENYAPDQILVKFKTNTTDQYVSSALSSFESKQLERIPKIDVFKVEIPSGITVEEMLYLIRTNPNVEYAEPNYRTRALLTPNDPLFRYQYALHNTGQAIGSVPGSPQGVSRADIRAAEGWEETKGNSDVVVAVIDSGIDTNHPDLKNKYISTGYDFVNDDDNAFDDFHHGTFVAGIIAAETNNSDGIAGIAWNCKILPVKTIDHEGNGFYDDMIEGIIWAADQGVDVINLSIGGDFPANSLKTALEYAFQKGVVIIAAAGNDNSPVLYPAAYDDFVLAVAATDYNDQRVSWSNHGTEIDVAAPGERILSCVPIGFFGPGSLPYGYGYGTSSASPMVAGFAALLISHKSWLMPADIMDIIRYSADDINSSEYPGNDEFVGYGRINMEKALVPIKITK